MKQTIAIVVTAIVAIVAGVATQTEFSSPSFSSDENMVKEFSLPDLENNIHRLSEWRGKIIILNFWATWCPPCLKEIPVFNQLQDKYKENGLQFIGIAIDEPEAVKEFIEFTNINYPVLIATDNGIQLSLDFGNTSKTIPFSVVLDRVGDVIYRHSGEFTHDEIVEQILPIMKSTTDLMEKTSS